jgi:uncharacterized membrane protein YqaE (UPF0057 family)
MKLSLPRTSHTVALASAVAFATQVAFALLMLRWFAPQDVGEFSVVSQIAFFWMTLALAQTPLSMLANQHLPAHAAAQHAWCSSLLRAVGLLPVAAGAVWLSHLALWPALLWALLLAVCQMGWMLAQSWTLRTGHAWQQATVRVLPPLTALVSAGLGMALSSMWLADAASTNPSSAWGSALLLACALLGYAVGALWFVPALRRDAGATSSQAVIDTKQSAATEQSDPRSATLRMAHTLVDALLATAIVVTWQRLYGAQETGYLTALLRVLGFVPAVVHMAWAQVALAHGGKDASTLNPATPWWLGLGAFVCVLGLGAAAAVALYMGWLDERWGGVWPYIAPLALWQGTACLSAAFAHRPFQTQSARTYSWLCMAVAAFQAAVLLVPAGLGQPLDAAAHLSAFAAVSGFGLLGLTIWMAKLR